MPLIDQPETITPAIQGLLSGAELCKYLNVGRNEISKIAARFSLTRIEGHFPERDVWRRILGVEPEDDNAATLLRTQLQDINWVAARIGRATSSIRNRIQSGTFEYPCGVQLGEVSKDGRKPRLRRWLPELIIATKIGDEISGLRVVKTPEAASSKSVGEGENSETGPRETVSKSPENNVFASIAQPNDRNARQR